MWRRRAEAMEGKQWRACIAEWRRLGRNLTIVQLMDHGLIARRLIAHRSEPKNDAVNSDSDRKAAHERDERQNAYVHRRRSRNQISVPKSPHFETTWPKFIADGSDF